MTEIVTENDVQTRETGGSLATSPLEDEAVSPEGAEDSVESEGTGGSTLEEQGDIAADYLEELLDIADIDGDIDIDVENGRASVAIVAEGGNERALRQLVGPKGEVLDALQELTRLAVHASVGERSRLMLDIAGFRVARRKAIEEATDRACAQVTEKGEPVELEPMSAYERKIAHDIVADKGLVSESAGQEPNRRVVISAS